MPVLYSWATYQGLAQQNSYPLVKSGDKIELLHKYSHFFLHGTNLSLQIKISLNELLPLAHNFLFLFQVDMTETIIIIILYTNYDSYLKEQGNQIATICLGIC